VSSRQITEDIYNRALDAFRADPGNVLNAARSAGISRPTAKKLWQGPLSLHMAAWARPCRDVVREEAAAQHQEKLRQEAESRKLAAEEHERRKRLEEEAARMEESALRLGRNNLLAGMGLLAQMVPGLKAQAKRLNDQLERGTDANGVPLPVDPEKILRTIGKWATASRDMTLVGKQLIELHRLQDGLPTAIVGLAPTDMTLEDAADLLGQAQEALERGRRQGQLDRAARGDGHAELPLSGDDTDDVDEGDDIPDAALDDDEPEPPVLVPGAPGR
jgi:hypothetical protein